MGYALVYNSKTGNGAKLADRIKIVCGLGENCIYCGGNSSKALKADLIFVGFWTYMSTCDDETKKFLQTLTNQNIVLFGTAGYMSEEYKTQIINNIKSILPSGVHVVGTYMCQGKMSDDVLQRYLKLKEAGNPKADELIANFNKAKSHPDDDDVFGIIKVIKETYFKYVKD